MEASTVVAIIRSVNTQKICKDKIIINMRGGLEVIICIIQILY